MHAQLPLFKPNDRNARRDPRLVQVDLPDGTSWGLQAKDGAPSEIYRFTVAGWSLVTAAGVDRTRVLPFRPGVPRAVLDRFEADLGRRLVLPTEIEGATVAHAQRMAEAVTVLRPFVAPEALGVDAAGRPFLWPELENELFLRDLVQRGALVLANLSGGKDSQAMLALLTRIVPREQLLAVHAHLPNVEWEGSLDVVRAQADAAGIELLIVQATMDFLEMVEDRWQKNIETAQEKGLPRPAPPWPSAKFRLCTKFLKIAPIQVAVRAWAEKRGFPLIVSASGVRAEESSRRAKQLPWQINDDMNLDPFRPVKRGPDRVWFNYFPVFRLRLDDTLSVIHAAGQRVHPAYYPDAEGGQNERYSCIFCVLASPNDLRMGALKNPELYAQYVAKEAKYGYAMHQSMVPLVELTGLTPDEARAKRRHLPVVTGPLERLARPERKGKGKGKGKGGPEVEAVTCVDEWGSWGRDLEAA